MSALRFLSYILLWIVCIPLMLLGSLASGLLADVYLDED
jgi:hypothetical protein